MMNKKLTPEGTSDKLFAAKAAEKKILRRLEKTFEAAGYKEVRTPGFEFLSVFSSSSFPQEEVYKLADSKGRLIAARPDNTLPIARLAATKLKGEKLPLKIYYSQSVFRRAPEYLGRDTEVLQAGVECIGEKGFDADAELLALAASALAETYKGNFRIEIGHIGLFKNLLEKLAAADEDKERIHRYVASKNYAALEEALEPYLAKKATKRAAETLLKLPRLFGGTEILSEAAAVFADADPEAKDILSYLKKIAAALGTRGFADKIVLDLGLVNEAEYYTSLVFRGYGESAGEPLLSGGRYDGLTKDFGADLPGAGFGINVDLLTEAALASAKKAAIYKERPLRVALTKGRLEKDFAALLEKAGYGKAPLADMGRKLLVKLEGANIEVFLAKAGDVVTYVEQGVCDVGVVGKDTLLERGGAYYEIMNLGFGKCRFALAAQKSGSVLKGGAPSVIASKYPNYAGRYFERKGQDVRIIKIDGSVELAPLLGLADGIVDIVQTGATLKENGLEVAEYIKEVSARLIVNLTSMKLRKKEVDEFEKRLRAAL